MSDAWHWYITIFTIANIIACFWLIRWTSKKRTGEAKQGDVTGHKWDEDLEEYNNPLPRWWLWGFYITLFFSILYLILYPGLGNFKGTLGWTQIEQYQVELDKADEKYGPLFASFRDQDIPTLAQDEQATAIGHRLYVNYCATCHGSDAGGARGFPSLKDSDWLYGNAPEQIRHSITYGRNGFMPPFGHLSDEQLNAVTAYVLSLSGREVLADQVAAGQQVYQSNCMACHGVDATGNQALGAPNLTDNIWLHGGSPGTVKLSIAKGRTGYMPPNGEYLGEDKVHLLTAFIYSLSMK
jgi:cytochrome c oxidase cbb3-type subunit 3